MPALVQDERIYETSVTSGTGEYTLAGAVTGFQPASVIGANNYLIGFVTDDTNWEAGIYTYVTGPDRLQRTHVVASSNADAAVNWGAGTKKLRCGPIAYFAPGRQVSKSVAGSSNVTLTALEQRCDTLELTGVLTGNIQVIVDTTKTKWTVKNSATGNFTITFKTAAGTGIILPQGLSVTAFCDGTNVLSAMAGLFEKTTVASATTPNIWSGTGPLIDYTGTTAATGFAQAPFAGASRALLCAAACSFTHGANLICPGSTNFTAAAGDIVIVHAVTTTQFRLAIIKANGQSVVGSLDITGLSALTAVDMAADYVPIYDTSAAANKKATPDYLHGGVRPAFGAQATNGQSIGTLTYGKVQYTVEDFDTNSNFDNATNYRFTPTVAGIYTISACVTMAAMGVNNLFQIDIRKNGTSVVKSADSPGGSAQPSVSASCVVSMNGSTDYIEVYAYNGSGGSQTLATAAGSNYFSGVRVP